MKQTFSGAAITAVFALAACGAFKTEKVSPETAVVIGVINNNQSAIKIEMHDAHGALIRTVGEVPAGDTSIFMIPEAFFRSEGRYFSLETAIPGGGPNMINRPERGSGASPSNRAPSVFIGPIPSLEAGTLIRLRIALVLSETPYPSILFSR